jgi:predicted anti-sigma-YlaC factor YlaD
MDFMMKCHNVQKNLSAYQDRELKPGEQEEVSKHLLKCQSCRIQYERLGQAWQILGELKEIQPDPWFYPQLVNKIKESRQGHLIPQLRWTLRLLPAPAIVTILLVIGLMAGTYLGNILSRFDLFPTNHIQTSRSSEETTLASLQVFDPVPPGTLAAGYLRMANYMERSSK